MIRNDREYKEAMERLHNEKERINQQRLLLEEKGLDDESINNLMNPMVAFHMQLKEEVESYERLKRGEFDEMSNLRGIGHLLVALRIAQGMSQRELASRLDVNESQVSRDERNEYHGVTIDRASRILEALGAQLRTKVELEPKRAA